MAVQRRTILATPGIENASNSLLVALIEIADEIGANPDWLAAVISFESGDTWSPSVRNKASGAVGLIQFTNIAASALNTTTAKLAKMSALEQMAWVRKYFVDVVKLKPGKVNSLADLYMAVLASKHVSSPGSTHIYSAPSEQYNKNQPLDRGNKGYITKDDAAQKVWDKYYKANNRRIEVKGDFSRWPVSTAGAGMPLLVMATAAGYYAMEWYLNRYGLSVPPQLSRLVRKTS